MSKITKKQLQHSVDLLNEENSSQHDYLMRIKRALKSIDIDILSDEFDEPKPKPKLKQLDQSIFDGLDEKWRFAAVDLDGESWVYREQPKIDKGDDRWSASNTPPNSIGTGYDTSNWQNSLIERESKEMKGSDYYHSRIASHLLEFSQKLVVCFASNISEADALSEKRIEVITSVDTEFTDADEYGWQFVVPINNQGEPLTASDVGL